MRVSTAEPAYRRSLPEQRPCERFPLILYLLGRSWVVTSYTRESVELREAGPRDYRPEPSNELCTALNYCQVAHT